MNPLQRWMAKASPDEKTRLARLAGISKSMLKWTAGAYRSGGKVDANPELARKLELATVKLHREGLDPLTREQLCQACSKCEYAKQVRKAAA